MRHDSDAVDYEDDELLEKKKRKRSADKADQPERILHIEMLPVKDPLRLPEHNLCFKVLMLAVLDLLQLANNRMHSDARKYIFRGDPKEDFSFQFCCDQLMLDAATLRDECHRLLQSANARERAGVRRRLSNILSS